MTPRFFTFDDLDDSPTHLDPVVHICRIEHNHSDPRVAPDVANLTALSLRVHEQVLTVVIDPDDVCLGLPARKKRGQNGVVHA
jgi:hypothetical protein